MEESTGDRPVRESAAFGDELVARFCVCGCGKELKTEEEHTDYDRVFFNASCRNKDKAQRLRDMRARARQQKICSKCGRPMPKKKDA